MMWHIALEQRFLHVNVAVLRCSIEHDLNLKVEIKMTQKKSCSMV